MNRKKLIILVMGIGIGLLFGFLSQPDQTEKVEQLHNEVNQLESELIDRQELVEEIQKLQQENEELKEQIEQFLDEWWIEEFEATAYTHVAIPGQPDINGTGDGLTATGKPVREGFVAVDPDVIPLGSEVWVEGFGWLKAEDTGGAIKGKRIDVFINDRQAALSFGRQNLIVIREENK